MIDPSIESGWNFVFGCVLIFSFFHAKSGAIIVQVSKKVNFSLV